MKQWPSLVLHCTNCIDRFPTLYVVVSAFCVQWEEFGDTKGAIRIRESKTTQWPKEKVQKDKQRSTKHTHKTKDLATQTPLKSGVNAGAPEG